MITVLTIVVPIIFIFEFLWNFLHNPFILQIDRQTQVDMLARHRQATGIRSWRKLLHYLTEMKCLFGPFSDHLCNPERVCRQLHPL